MKVYSDISELIGQTPLVRLNKMNKGKANVLVKLEYFNPAGSIKDRVAHFIITQAEKEGKINKDTLIIEPTSGNTGIGLAMCCAIKGYKLLIVMPENMSEERKKILRGYGAELILTPKELGMKASLDKAFEIASTNPNSFIPSQFSNPNNKKVHELTTAKEIFDDTDGEVDVVVAGVGTGGTISGIGKDLKKLNSNIKIIAFEPEESPLISKGVAGLHGIQGIGANFIPDNFDRSCIDKVVTVKTEDAINTAKEVGYQEGILVGISSGAAVKVALDLSNDNSFFGKNIVAILPDSGERYLSTALFN